MIFEYLYIKIKDMKVKRWGQFNENHNRPDNESVKSGDKVYYEKETDGFEIVQGHRITKKIMKVGTVIGKIQSIGNLSPKFL